MAAVRNTWRWGGEGEGPVGRAAGVGGEGGGGRPAPSIQKGER